jgi:hypothetical protein
MITETPDVEEALAPLRARGATIDFRRLVVLGARAQMTEIEQTELDDADVKARQQEALDAIRELVDVDYLMSDEAWR